MVNFAGLGVVMHDFAPSSGLGVVVLLVSQVEGHLLAILKRVKPVGGL